MPRITLLSKLWKGVVYLPTLTRKNLEMIKNRRHERYPGFEVAIVDEGKVKRGRPKGSKNKTYKVEVFVEKKKRGRPVGSKNKPKK